ncbi:MULTISPECIES: response regulator transcription factor [Empedobacter]|uniref:response regulator transcription factor n=1 Tax=Empedobacter TaxID=59734 RepID=UPI0025C10204|nr:MULTISPECIES: LuxR C-terminal-related transcriptional regulator [unclassified Empedobacter]
MELQFFQMIRTVEPDRRKDFCITSRLRLAGSQKSLIHKMFYFSDAYHQNVELALCFYHFDFLSSLDSTGMIINTAEGSIIRQAEVDNSNFLSAREKEIMKMIQLGKKSKEIADALFISINTVNRHRQNILEKMRVSNTTEACTLAAKLRWI